MGWLNQRRLIRLIGNIPPAKAEIPTTQLTDATAAHLTPSGFRQTRRDSERHMVAIRTVISLQMNQIGFSGVLRLCKAVFLSNAVN